ESFNAALKREVLRDRKVFDNPIVCRQEVFRWCMRYNTRRRHSEVSQVLFRLSRWENLEHAKKI
ncbi:integrase core domain-containing protein, partial [Corynebacterium striatum]|uniref:integrase core domain-containing protein n=1 Tax=Corynebacterium striatum TaxID=43770 RepID=UPI003AC4E290